MIAGPSTLDLNRDASFRLTVRLFIRSSALVLLGLFPHRSGAQATTNPQVDASVLPRGILGVRIATSWTRFDELFGAGTSSTGGPRNIAFSLATDSLTTTLAPQLSASENSIRTLSGTPSFRLTAGSVVAAANSRVVTAPLILEYGLTSRLTLGVVVPLVETRSTVYAQLNPKLGTANVGPNPGLLNTTLRASEAQLVASFRGAATALSQRLTQCQAAPTPDCSSLLSQQAAAQALIQSTGVTANAIESLYGGDDAHPGQPFVPLASSTVEAAIEARIAGLVTQYQALLPSTIITGGIAGAGGPGARFDMQQMLANVGRDSLQLIDRSSIGDVSVGGTLQVFDTFHDSTKIGSQVRLAIHGGFRFGTGEPANRNKILDVGTGYGQSGVELGAAGDAILGRHLSGSVIASYTAQLGTVNVARVPTGANLILPLTVAVPGTYSAGNVASITIIPRWRLAGDFVLDGRYSLTNIAADQYTPAASVGTGLLGNAAATTHAIGFGFSYSTFGIGKPTPRDLPYEVSFSHLETIAASGGPTPKLFRDQVTLRVFFGR
jgi:hypothetical protein